MVKAAILEKLTGEKKTILYDNEFSENEADYISFFTDAVALLKL